MQLDSTAIQVHSLQFDTRRIRLSELLGMIHIPDFQRLQDADHVMEIYKYNENYYQSTGSFNFFGSISLGLVIRDEIRKFFVLDGQHRIGAYKMLMDKFGDFQVSVDIYTRQHVEDVQDIYYRINRNKPVPLMTDSCIEEVIINKTMQQFVQVFGHYVKTTKKPHPPNLNAGLLQEALVKSEIITKGQFQTAEEVMSAIRELNYYLSSIPYPTLMAKQSEWGITLKFEKMQFLDSEKMFMLGYFSEFEWIGFIIRHRTEGIPYHEMTFSSVRNTTKIPKQRRNELWNHYFGGYIEGVCYVCNQTVTVHEFEAGHVVPRAFGGSNELDNLRPICKTCNRDMGTQNMEKYKLNF